MSLYIIAYDVALDSRRDRVAALLEDFGTRVQYSVFEADVSDRTMQKLMSRARDLIDPTTDSLRAYSLCARCRGSVVVVVVVVGKGPAAGETEDVVVV